MPSPWTTIKLAEALAFIGNGLTADQNKSGIGLPVSRIETIAGDTINPSRVGYVSGLSDDTVEKYLLRPRDILFSHINSEPQIGRAVVYEGKPAKLLHGMNLLRLRLNEAKLDSFFVMHVFRHYREKGVFVGLASRAVGQSSINQGRLKSLEIPSPPLPEQRAIARALRTVQEAKEARQRELALERERKAALMEHFFTFGPRPLQEVNRVGLRETEIGFMPQHWQVAAIGELGEIVTGTTPATAVAGYYGGSYMFVTPGDIGDTRCLLKTQRYLSEEGLRVSRTLRRDSVLVVCIGATIGKVAMTTALRSSTNQQINAVVPNEKVHPEYLYYALVQRSPYLPSLAGRAAVPIVNKSNFAKFCVPLPPMPEQARIADVLTACDSKTDALAREMALLDELFRAMLEELMTGRLSAVPLIEQEASR